MDTHTDTHTVSVYPFYFQFFQPRLKSKTGVRLRLKAFTGLTPQLNISSEVKCSSTQSAELLSLHFVLVEMTGEAELCQDSYRSLSALTACHYPALPIASAALRQT